jgi:hypothetical protein
MGAEIAAVDVLGVPSSIHLARAWPPAATTLVQSRRRPMPARSESLPARQDGIRRAMLASDGWHAPGCYSKLLSVG